MNQSPSLPNWSNDVLRFVVILQFSMRSTSRELSLIRHIPLSISIITPRIDVFSTTFNININGCWHAIADQFRSHKDPNWWCNTTLTGDKFNEFQFSTKTITNFFPHFLSKISLIQFWRDKLVTNIQWFLSINLVFE